MSERNPLFGVNRNSCLSNSSDLFVAAAVGFAGFCQHGRGSCIGFTCHLSVHYLINLGCLLVCQVFACVSIVFLLILRSINQMNLGCRSS